MGGYRYGFNGQEKSKEINGDGNSYTAQFWEYDSRTGRRWNLDPEPIIGISDYASFRNSPILYSDPLGNTSEPPAWMRLFVNVISNAVPESHFVENVEYLGNKAKETYKDVKYKVTNVELKSWSQVKSDFERNAGYLYWSGWGVVNGMVKVGSLGMYSRSPEDFNLTETQAGYYRGGTAAAETVAMIEGMSGGGTAPRLALANDGAVLRSSNSLQLGRATTVYAASSPSSSPNSTSSGSSSSPSASGAPASRKYDRPFTEPRSGIAVRQKNVLARWDQFLGPFQTNIDPRDGMVDPDRIWSVDGLRSIRFGSHEGTPDVKGLLHYHEETWSPTHVLNTYQKVQR